MKHRRREWLVSRVERQKQKEIRLAKKRKNWWYHHKWQIIAKATGRVQITRIRFPKHVYLSDPNEKIFKKINEAEKKERILFIFSMVQNIDVGSMLYIKILILITL